MRSILFSFLACILSCTMHAQTAPEGLAEGSQAPAFSATDQQGKKVSLQILLAKGPVVLVFYRGYWCPYCNRYLKKLEDSLVSISSKGASLVAVTPEKPESISKTLEKTKASYPVLFDEGMAIMKSYGVNYAVDTATIARYKKYNIDFDATNGSNGANLPVPAVYVINPNGKITYRFFNTDYTKRPSVKEITNHL